MSGKSLFKCLGDFCPCSSYNCDNVLQTCPGRCLEFKECVQCQVYKTGKLTEEECARNCTFVPRVIDVVEGESVHNFDFIHARSVLNFP